MICRGEAHHHGEVEVARKTRRGQMLATKSAPIGLSEDLLNEV